MKAVRENKPIIYRGTAVHMMASFAQKLEPEDSAAISSKG